MSTPPSLIARVRVDRVVELSPNFIRIELTGPELADFGTEHRSFDQRIKLIFPSASGVLPTLPDSDDWYDAWLQLPETERGAMRSYTIRDVTGSGAEKRLAVDFVLHLAEGATGPASSWASQAAPGDEIMVIGPRLGNPPRGIEWDPGEADNFVLCGDETAVPAISRILADLPADARGSAFLEVPSEADVLTLEAPSGVSVTWLPRNGAPLGACLIPASLAHLGVQDATAPSPDGSAPVSDSSEPAETEIWETPTYSSAGLDVADNQTDRGIPGLYAWIAGESGMVTTLRRHLVRDLGIDRKQVAFMGYWRQGVAMRG